MIETKEVLDTVKETIIIQEIIVIMIDMGKEKIDKNVNQDLIIKIDKIKISKNYFYIISMKI